ncbi:MAG: T9SS type A sorting domain-containing protein [Bacteroidota bacterium]|nr:T9SS type A sorting domain-containing protein [Bacteroidota bacterium]
MKKVSSESGYDFLKFYIDNVEMGIWSGEDDWSLETYNVLPGNHQFKWEYEKDYSVSSGADAAWIDDVVFPIVFSGGNVGQTSILKHDITIYPNPAQHTLHVSAIDNIDFIRVLNLTGQCVYEELSTEENLKYAEIPLHKLSSGYYIIQVQTSQELTNKKFTISK